VTTALELLDPARTDGPAQREEVAQ